MKLIQFKYLISIIIGFSICTSSCVDKKTPDCANIEINSDLLNFEVTQISMSDKRYSQYVRNEAKYFDKKIELSSTQIDDTLSISYVSLEGNCSVLCANMSTFSDSLNFTIYHTTCVSELSLKKYKFDILNPSKKQLGPLNVNYELLD